jgi:hypothetical protein
MRPAFADEQLEATFCADGYVVVDVLGADDVASLLGVNDRVDPLAPEASRSAFAVRGPGSDAVGDALAQAHDRTLAALLPGMQYLMGGLLSKHPGRDTAVAPHRDLPMVEAGVDRMVRVFLALMDMDDTDGCLWVSPGSHRLPATRQGFATRPSVPAPAVCWPHLQPVPLRAGQAILFDARLLHGSKANLGDRARVAATIALVPTDARLVYHAPSVDRDDEVIEYDVDVEFFHRLLVDTSLEEQVLEGRPWQAVPASDPITEADLDALRGYHPGPAVKLARRVWRRARRAA